MDNKSLFNEVKLTSKQKYNNKIKEEGYFINYYQLVTKNKKFHCEYCNKEYDISNKARHLKNKKHYKNVENSLNVDYSSVNE
jgi:hypothetical protein